MATTLYCLHHAGGTDWQFRSWARKLPDFDIIPLRLERPESEDYRSIEDMASDALDGVDISTLTASGFYGHSMGGLVAFEMCRQLAGDKVSPPSAVILGAIGAPGSLPNPDEAMVSLRADNSLATNLPANVIARVSAGVERSYRYSPPSIPLDVELDLILGRKDSLATQQTAAGWSEYCTRQPQLHSIDGGHLFHRENSDEFLAMLTQLLKDATSKSLEHSVANIATPKTTVGGYQ